jgi:hypothetical protein
MRENSGVWFRAVTARLLRIRCAKSARAKKNRTSLARTRTPKRLLRFWRALAAQAKAMPVRLSGDAHG